MVAVHHKYVLIIKTMTNVGLPIKYRVLKRKKICNSLIVKNASDKICAKPKFLIYHMLPYSIYLLIYNSVPGLLKGMELFTLVLSIDFEGAKIIYAL